MGPCNNKVLCKNETKALARSFFEVYDDPKYLRKETEFVSKGGSGVALKLTFEKDRVSVPVLLKVETGENSEKADNLYREGLIGAEINLYCDIFPCFVRTLGLFKESEDGEYEIEVETHPFKFKRLVHEPSIADACKYFGKEAIMLEYVEGKPFKNYYKERTFEHELIPVLFQIYYALWVLADGYTHYDLHTGNVMLSRPDPKGCIAFEYELPTGEVVHFMGSYVATIIDYGRSFVFPYKDKLKEAITHEKECNDPRCGHHGEKCGFRNFQNPKHKGLGFRHANISHDLRLLNYAVNRMREAGKWDGPDIIFNEGGFSTEEIRTSGLPKHGTPRKGSSPVKGGSSMATHMSTAQTSKQKTPHSHNKSPNPKGHINNVIDAGIVLANMVNNNHENFKGVPVIGELKVNGKTKWTFEEANGTKNKSNSPHSSSNKSGVSKKSNSESNNSHKSHSGGRRYFRKSLRRTRRL
jgi:hypothetical protein